MASDTTPTARDPQAESYELHNRGEQPLTAINVMGKQESQAFLVAAPDDTSSNKRGSSQYPRRRVPLLAAWWFEILSLLVAIGALVAIAVTLIRFNQKEQPAWKYRLNLNTLIAILSTLLRVCMLFGVEEGKTQFDRW
jgi:hypothetical protein